MKQYKWRILIVALFCAVFSLYATTANAADYEYVEDAILADSSISYDKNTQALLMIDFNANEAEYVKYQDHDEYLQGMANYYESATVAINGVTYSGDYYIVSEDGTITKKNTGRVYDWTTGNVDVYSDKISVIILNANDSYDVWMDKNDYTWTHNGPIAGRATTPEDEGHFTGTINSDANNITHVINFDTYLQNGFNIEYWVIDKDSRKIDNPGFIDRNNTYIMMKVELRDPDGNIFPMKTNEVYDSFGDDDYYLNVLDGGIVRVDIDYEDTNPALVNGYGEIDGLTYPTGYDFRITVADCSEALGQFANLYMDYNGAEMDEDGFVSGGADTYIFTELTFVPRTGEIRVENLNPNNVQGADSGVFQVVQQVSVQNDSSYWDSEAGKWVTDARALGEYKQPMSNYSYKIYDANTNEEVEPDVVHKTDANGRFRLKTNQYAIFKVYEYPDDMDEYERWGINIFDAIAIQPEIVDSMFDYYIASVDDVPYDDIYNNSGTKYTKNFAPIKKGESMTYVILSDKSGGEKDENSSNPNTMDNAVGYIVIFAAFSLFSAMAIRIATKR